MRKLLLVLVLISSIGLGCGQLTEDLCALGGAFADDPSTAVGVLELALPTHAHAVRQAVAPLTVFPVAADPVEAAISFRSLGEMTPAGPASPNPIRC